VLRLDAARATACTGHGTTRLKLSKNILHRALPG